MQRGTPLSGLSLKFKNPPRQHVDEHMADDITALEEECLSSELNTSSSRRHDVILPILDGISHQRSTHTAVIAMPVYHSLD